MSPNGYTSLCPLDVLAMSYLGRDQVHALLKVQLLFDTVNSNEENTSFGLADLLIGTSVVLGDVDELPAAGLKARTITTVTWSSQPVLSAERDWQASTCHAGHLLTRLRLQLMPASVSDPCASRAVLHLSDGSSVSLSSISPRQLCSDFTDLQLGVLCAEASWRRLMQQPGLHCDTDNLYATLQRQAMGLGCSAKVDRVLLALAAFNSEAQLPGLPAGGGPQPVISIGSLLMSMLSGAPCTCPDQMHAAILDGLSAVSRSCEVARGKLPELIACAQGQLLPRPVVEGSLELELARRYLSMAEDEVRLLREHEARKQCAYEEERASDPVATHAPAIFAAGLSHQRARHRSGKAQRSATRDGVGARGAARLSHEQDHHDSKKRDSSGYDLACAYDLQLAALLEAKGGRLRFPELQTLLPIPKLLLQHCGPMQYLKSKERKLFELQNGSPSTLVLVNKHGHTGSRSH